MSIDTKPAGASSAEEIQAGRWANVETWLDRVDHTDVRLEIARDTAAYLIAEGIVNLIDHMPYSSDKVVQHLKNIRIKERTSRKTARRRETSDVYKKLEAGFNRATSGLVDGEVGADPLIRRGTTDKDRWKDRSNIAVGKKLSAIVGSRR